MLADLPPSAQWVVLAIAVAATAFALFRGRSRLKKDPLARPPDANSLAQQRSVERQMQNLLIELSEMARQVTAGLDTRAAKLDLLIREADEKIATLSALNARAGRHRNLPYHHHPPPRLRPPHRHLLRTIPIPGTSRFTRWRTKATAQARSPGN